MDDIISQFINGKIGLNIQQSNRTAALSLSDRIQYRDMSGLSLYDHYLKCIIDDWEILVSEKSKGLYNAYRRDSADRYRVRYPVCTAEELLLMIEQDESNNFSEEDIELLLSTAE